MTDEKPFQPPREPGCVCPPGGYAAHCNLHSAVELIDLADDRKLCAMAEDADLPVDGLKLARAAYRLGRKSAVAGLALVAAEVLKKPALAVVRSERMVHGRCRSCGGGPWWVRTDAGSVPCPECRQDLMCGGLTYERPCP